MPKMKLSCCDRSDQVQSKKKTRQDNDMINHIGLVYAENDIELSRPIRPRAVCDKTK